MPELATLYIADLSDPMKAYKRLTDLCRKHQDTTESSTILMQAALDAGLWGEIRRLGINIIKQHQANDRIYSLMAKLEIREFGNADAAQIWTTKAFAPTTPSYRPWHCEVCGTSQEAWTDHCPSCHNFACLTWNTARQSMPAALE